MWNQPRTNPSAADTNQRCQPFQRINPTQFRESSLSFWAPADFLYVGGVFSEEEANGAFTVPLLCAGATLRRGRVLGRGIRGCVLVFWGSLLKSRDSTEANMGFFGAASLFGSSAREGFPLRLFWGFRGLKPAKCRPANVARHGLRHMAGLVFLPFIFRFQQRTEKI